LENVLRNGMKIVLRNGGTRISPKLVINWVLAIQAGTLSRAKGHCASIAGAYKLENGGKYSKLPTVAENPAEKNPPL
jgi:hypothetical protein